MTKSSSHEIEILRVHVMLIAMLAGFLVLVGALWRIQVARGDEYNQELADQSIRRVRLPGTRGRILARHGESLAENRPSYCIAIYLEQLRQLERTRSKSLVEMTTELVDRLAAALGLEREVTEQDIRHHIRKRSPLPLLAWEGVGEEAIAMLVEGPESFPAVDIYLQPVRHYPRGSLAAHVIGYVGRDDQGGETGKNPDEEIDYYLPDFVGRRGIERTMEYDLRGHAGGQVLRVDVSGFKRDLPYDLSVMRSESRSPERGSDLRLTLDVKMQEFAERAIAGKKGAVVVMDTRNGDILAMASYPSFDLNLFSGGISRNDWDALNGHGDRPLVNRAVSGQYPPGSVFKVIVAMAALEQGGNITRNTHFQCPGFYELSRTRRLRCWNWERGGHGTLALVKAIEQSCNTYFCHLGYRCGYEHVYAAALALGMGSRTGIELDAERPGLLPHPDSVRYKGDVANVSIGQGRLLVTPLQMAVATAAIANGGLVYRPRLVQAIREANKTDFEVVPPHLERSVPWSEASLKVVRQGMFDVINAPSGTGKRARVNGIGVAGKTGTAEFGPKGDSKTRGWMAAFAPFDEPQVAVAIVIEDAVSGGRTVAPRIGWLMAGIFGKEQGEAVFE